MLSSPWLLLFLLINVAALSPFVYGQGRVEWDASTYPNPTADGYQRCLMKSPSSVCDPDAVLTEQQRYRINYELTQLESRTRQLNGGDFCEKKGIVGAVALAKHVRGGSENAVKAMANDILRKWTLDNQCQKSLVIVIATEDRRVWVGRGDRVPVYATELTEVTGAQKELFRQGDYPQALLNILQGVWDKALSKQTPMDDGRSRGTPFVPGGGDRDGDRDGGRVPQRGGDGKGFHISRWLWLLLLLLVIPTLLCCCCVYFCCCRGKGGDGGNTNPHPNADAEQGGYRGGAGAGRAGGGGGNALTGFLSGMGGAAAMNTVSGFFRRGRGGAGGGAAPPPYNPGYTPGVPQPQQGGGGGGAGTGGRGLYPSVPVKDEGGGTNW